MRRETTSSKCEYTRISIATEETGRITTATCSRTIRVKTYFISVSNVMDIRRRIATVSLAPSPPHVPGQVQAWSTLMKEPISSDKASIIH